MNETATTTTPVLEWIEQFHDQLDAIEKAVNALYGTSLNCPPPQSESDVSALIHFRRRLGLPPGPADGAARMTAAQAAHQNLVLSKVSCTSGAFLTLLDGVERMLQSAADAGRLGMLSRACFKPEELHLRDGQFVCRAGPGGAALPPGHVLRQIVGAEGIPLDGMVPLCPAEEWKPQLGGPSKKNMPAWFKSEPIRAFCQALAAESQRKREQIEEQTRAENEKFQRELLQRRRAALESQLSELTEQEKAHASNP